jgi:hypothetical protein
MTYISKNNKSKEKGIAMDFNMTNETMEGILSDMVHPDLLREPLTEELKKKQGKQGNNEDVRLLRELLEDLNKTPLNPQQFMNKLAMVKDL